MKGSKPLEPLAIAMKTADHMSSGEPSGTFISLSIELLPAFIMSAVPIMVSLFFSISALNLMLFMAAGTYSENPISGADSSQQSVVFAGVSLCQMYTNVTFLSVLIGLASAMETLGSQNNGAGNYREAGLTLQRCCLILSVVSIPVAFLWVYAHDIFRYIGVTEDVCQVVKTFMRIRLFAMPMDIMNVSYDKYLMSLGVMNPTMYAAVVQNGTLLMMLYVSIHWLHLDYSCLAWGVVIAVYTAGISKFLFSYRHPCVQRTLQAPDISAFEGWGNFLRLGTPGCAMVCAEWWAFELLTLMASGRGTEAIAAQTIIAQTSGVSFMVPLGMAISTTSMVGNAIGAGHMKHAQLISALALVVIFSLEVLLGIGLHFVGRYYDMQFTHDEVVLNLALSALPFLSLFVILDGVQCVAAGVCRGAGKQYIGAVTSFTCYYFVGLPMAYLMCYNFNFGVKGLLIGISTGTLLQCIVFMYLLFIKKNYIYDHAVTEPSFKHIDVRGVSFYNDPNGSRPHSCSIEQMGSFTPVAGESTPLLKGV